MSRTKKINTPTVEYDPTNIFQVFEHTKETDGEAAAITAVYHLGKSEASAPAPVQGDPVDLEPMVQTMQRLHSLVIAMTEALAGAEESNRQAIEFAPGMRFIDNEMHGLLTSMEVALYDHNRVEGG